MAGRIRAALSGLICAAMAVTMLAPGASAETYLKSRALENATTDEILADMGVGWNLGNTLDATGGTGVNSETSWGCPKTTQELISTVKSLGFNTVRVPVSWANHVTGTDYTINERWLDRVQEVVDYCYNEDMYVIINIHHDNKDKLSTSKKGFSTDSAYLASSEKFVKSIWSQVAERFEDYDYHLIFETLNEPRRINYYGSGGQSEWWFPVNSPDANIQDSISTINTLNQDAVNVIRSKDGYNKNRLIMCPGYAASLDGAITPNFKLPTDTAGNDRRIVASVHGYVPYNFAMDTGNSKVEEYNSTMKSQLKSIMNTIKTKLIDKGIPVVMGEFSATAYKSLDERLKWAADYSSLACDMNMPIILWDNNAFNKYDENGNPNSECHGYIDRSNNTVSSEQSQVLSKIFTPYKNRESGSLKTNLYIFCDVAGQKLGDRTQSGDIYASATSSSGEWMASFFIDREGGKYGDMSFKDGDYTFRFTAKNCVTKDVTVKFKGGQPTEPIEEIINLKGDVDGDGKVNNSDLLIMKSHIKGVKKLSGYELACADVDGSGSVNNADLIAVKSHIKSIKSLWT